MNSLQIQFEIDRLNASLRDVFRIVVYGNMGNSNATERMIASYDSLLDNLTQRLTERLTDMQHNSSLHDTMESLSHMCFDKSRFEPPPYSIPAIPVRAAQNHISPNVIVTKAEQHAQSIHNPPTLVVDEAPDNRSPFVKVLKSEPTELVFGEVVEDEVVEDEVVEDDDELEAEEEEAEEEEAEEEEQEEEEAEEEEQEEAEEEEAEEEEATELRTIRKKQYHVGITSQIAYAYVDDETRGEEVGIVKDGRVVPTIIVAPNK